MAVNGIGPGREAKYGLGRGSREKKYTAVAWQHTIVHEAILGECPHGITSGISQKAHDVVRTINAHHDTGLLVELLRRYRGVRTAQVIIKAGRRRRGR